MKWCEHIKWEDWQGKGNYLWHWAKPYQFMNHYCVDDRYQFCPICGAKRPEKTKKLWEIFSEELLPGKPIPLRDIAEKNAVIKWLANTAIDEVLRIVDEMMNSPSILADKCATVSGFELKTRLEELRG